MCASSRRVWWERSAEAPLFAHHTRGLVLFAPHQAPVVHDAPIRCVCHRTIPLHFSSPSHLLGGAGAAFFVAHRAWTSTLGHCRSIVVPVPRNTRRVRQASALSRLPMLRLAVHRAPQRAKTWAVAEKSARLLPKSPPFFAQTRPLFMRTNSAPRKRR